MTSRLLPGFLRDFQPVPGQPGSRHRLGSDYTTTTLTTLTPASTRFLTHFRLTRRQASTNNNGSHTHPFTNQAQISTLDGSRTKSSPFDRPSPIHSSCPAPPPDHSPSHLRVTASHPAGVAMPQSSTSVRAARAGAPFRVPAARRRRAARSLWQMQRPRRSGGKCRWVLRAATVPDGSICSVDIDGARSPTSAHATSAEGRRSSAMVR